MKTVATKLQSSNESEPQWVLLCDECYEDGTGLLAECQDVCNLGLSHAGVCDENREDPQPCYRCERTTGRLTEIDLRDCAEWHRGRRDRMSGQLISHHNGPLAVACPKCGSEAGRKCRTLTTKRSTDTHEARWLAWFNRPRPVLAAEDDLAPEAAP